MVHAAARTKWASRRSPTRASCSTPCGTRRRSAPRSTGCASSSHPTSVPPYGDGEGWSHDDELVRLRAFIEPRRAAIEAELAGGTLAADVFASGTGTVDVVLDGQAQIVTAVGARAGLAEPNVFESVEIEAQLADGTALIAVVLVPRTELTPMTVALDWVQHHGVLMQRFPELGFTAIVGYLGPAVLHLDEASIAAGAPVTGTITGAIAWP